MKKSKLASALTAAWGLGSAFALTAVTAPSARAANAVDNPLFYYTHLLPSPFTMPAGHIVLGTQVAFGLTDFLQVGTDALRDIFKVYNANAKLALLDYPEFALALTLGFESYNYHDIDDRNPDASVTAWQPGAVTGFALLPNLAWFWGANLNLTSSTLDADKFKTSGYVEGAVLESDLSWAYNPKKKSVGNVLSSGVSYDVTYKILGFGVSHHWRGLHVGIHYYPNADQYKVHPILSGGASVDI